MHCNIVEFFQSLTAVPWYKLIGDNVRRFNYDRFVTLVVCTTLRGRTVMTPFSKIVVYKSTGRIEQEVIAHDTYQWPRKLSGAGKVQNKPDVGFI